MDPPLQMRLLDEPRSIFTVAEVAEKLRCSRAHVHNLINGKVPGARRLPSLQLGRRRLVRRESLETWLQHNERDGIEL